MPNNVSDFKNYLANLIQQREQRRAGRKKEEAMLPADLTGQVFTAAREEAAKIKKWMDAVESEVTRVEGQIKEANKTVRDACPHTWNPSRRKGSILFDFEVVPASPAEDRRVLSDEALELKKELLMPLTARHAALVRELAMRRQELGHLSRIADRAAAGSVTLIHFLSDYWRSRLEIGGAVEGHLAKLHGQLVDANTDMFGNRLPPEALGEDGQPDLPRKKVPV